MSVQLLQACCCGIEGCETFDGIPFCLQLNRWHLATGSYVAIGFNGTAEWLPFTLSGGTVCAGGEVGFSGSGQTFFTPGPSSCFPAGSAEEAASFIVVRTPCANSSQSVFVDFSAGRNANNGQVDPNQTSVGVRYATFGTIGISFPNTFQQETSGPIITTIEVSWTVTACAIGVSGTYTRENTGSPTSPPVDKITVNFSAELVGWINPSLSGPQECCPAIGVNTSSGDSEQVIEPMNNGTGCTNCGNGGVL